jgi:NitT/TauT family transport system permease protein
MADDPKLPEPATKVAGSTVHTTHGSRPSRNWLGLFLPNRTVSPMSFRLLVVAQLLVFLLIWIRSPFEVLPQPDEVFRALGNLWTEQGLAQDLIASLKLNLHAMAWTVVIGLSLCYLTVVPFFRPIAAAVGKGRFLSLTGFSLIFVLMVGGGYPLKLWILVFGMTVFFVTSMADVVAAIPRDSFDHARSLRMSEWRVVGEVVVLGTLDKAFEVLRQNAAMGWLMLTLVEGIVRVDGGLGAALLNQEKGFHIDKVFAIQLVILLVGLTQDWAIGALRRLICPYADLRLERRGA